MPLVPRAGKKFTSDDFRAHFSFLALMMVCFACIVYLMGKLRSIFRPFLWALFLVMVLTPAVSSVESVLLRCSHALCGCISAFCSGVMCICRCIFCMRSSRLRNRGADSRPGVSREMETRPEIIGTVSADQEDRHERSDRSDGSKLEIGEAASPERDETETRDTRAQSVGPCFRMLLHGVAIAIVVALVVCAVGGVILMVVQSVLRLQDDWKVYKKGAENVAQTVQRIVTRATGSMPAAFAEDISQQALEKVEEVLSAIVGEILGNAWRMILEFLMMALYIAFWLAAPMPLGTQMEELFRRYILLKGLACCGYGLCVGVLLGSLGVDLAPAFGLFAFLLSFVPEVGAIVALILPAPVILFDSRLESPGMTLFVATLAQLGLKFVFANVVEVKLVEADQLMKMHPVVILMAVTFFGFIWGPTGMLLAVPLVAYFKAGLLSVPACYRDPVLVLLEGDRLAPVNYSRKMPGLTTGIEMVSREGCAEGGEEVSQR